ncbi:hypothetical protein [Candidatus Nitrotoga arctica]|uniref:SMODS and SLOG-associating 2TM effector domain-containing protein n=1 Tax=Candidatus Nitrotoga arctica TaxID=453162 RepID=A0ABN8AQN6_9PROT|nr:hypothetical protein [Candidatus Nitrotoga arctica]CAG9932958.1 conserved protein of unknown function [Candidatus Nitrotoga arctica]
MTYSNLNAVIDMVAHGELQGLKASYPGNESRFSVYKHFGAEETAPVSLAATPSSSGVELAHAKAGDKANREQLDKLLAYARKKMNLAFWIKQGGAIGAVLTSAITAYLAWTEEGKSNSTFLTALAAVAGSLVATLSELVIKSPSGVSIASPNEFAKLVALRMDAERIKLSLARMSVGSVNEVELNIMLHDQDEIALQVMRYSIA